MSIWVRVAFAHLLVDTVRYYPTVLVVLMMLSIGPATLLARASSRLEGYSIVFSLLILLMLSGMRLLGSFVRLFIATVSAIRSA